MTPKERARALLAAWPACWEREPLLSKIALALDVADLQGYERGYAEGLDIGVKAAVNIIRAKEGSCAKNTGHVDRYDLIREIRTLVPGAEP